MKRLIITSLSALLLVALCSSAMTPTEKTFRQTEKYISDLKTYDIDLTVPAGFSPFDLRGRNDVYSFINDEAKIFDRLLVSHAAAALESDNEEALFLFPAVYNYGIVPALQRADAVELDLRISQNNMDLDVGPMVEIIALDDMSTLAGADTVAVYNFDFKTPVAGIYKHCVGIYLRKAAHPGMLIRIALSDKGYEKKDDYIRLLFDNIRFGDNPVKELALAEQNTVKSESEFKFPSEFKKSGGIYVSMNDETVIELDRQRKWLREHGMLKFPEISDESLDSYLRRMKMRINRQAEEDSIWNSDAPDSLKFYPFPSHERQAQFPGTFKDIFKWIDDNLKYPSDAYRKGVQGLVVVSFTVTPEGKIRNPFIKEAGDHILPSMKKEALRLASSMPDWTPARFRGKDVYSHGSLYISFRLPEKRRAEIAAKIKPSSPDYDKVTVRDPEISAVFPGGNNALVDWIASHINYTPEILKEIERNGSGGVSVSFTVARDGSVVRPTVGFATSRGLIDEALRVIMSLPDFIPAFDKGKAVATRQNVTVNFKTPEK